MNNHHSFHVAIIAPNTLAVLGLRQILQSIMPMMDVETFGSFTELQANDPDRYCHFFVDISVVVSNMAFFTERRRKTIVLTTQLAQLDSPNPALNFHTIFVNQPEKQLVKQILQLRQEGHRNHLHDGPSTPETLSRREIEVLSLIAQGMINKQIADRLHISITTVITHRKNIVQKLRVKTVSALTIYAVMHGYVDVNKI